MSYNGTAYKKSAGFNWLCTERAKAIPDGQRNAEPPLMLLRCEQSVLFNDALNC
jgi:hypothetical protein